MVRTNFVERIPKVEFQEYARARVLGVVVRTRDVCSDFGSAFHTHAELMRSQVVGVYGGDSKKDGLRGQSSPCAPHGDGVDPTTLLTKGSQGCAEKYGAHRLRNTSREDEVNK